MNKFEVANVAAGALDTLLAFVVEHLIPQAPEDEAVTLGEVKELLEESLEAISALGKVRRDRLKMELSKFARDVLACPRCSERALRLTHHDRRCYYCEHSWGNVDPDDIADEYVNNVLSISEYEEVRSGGDWPVSSCVECESRALVRGVVFLDSPQKPVYACFSCEAVFEYDELGSCSRCHDGLYRRTPADRLEEDGEIDVCGDCWEYLIEGE